MNAYALKRFKKGFVLDEAAIRKLFEIMQARANQPGVEAVPVKLKVYRKDSLVYETSNVDEVLREENSKRNLIESIEFIVTREEEFELVLDFSKGNLSVLKIEGSSRDTVFLTLSDLREYLDTEVCVLRRVILPEPLGFLTSYAIPTMLVSICVLTAGFWTHSVSPAEIAAATQSSSIAAKLNFLISLQADSRRITLILRLFPFTLATPIFVFALRQLIFALYPSNIFAWGKELDRFNKMKELRAKFGWGVIVSLFIGILGSVVAYYLTKGK